MPQREPQVQDRGSPEHCRCVEDCAGESVPGADRYHLSINKEGELNLQPFLLLNVPLLDNEMFCWFAAPNLTLFLKASLRTFAVARFLLALLWLPHMAEVPKVGACCFLHSFLTFLLLKFCALFLSPASSANPPALSLPAPGGASGGFCSALEGAGPSPFCPSSLTKWACGNNGR